MNQSMSRRVWWSLWAIVPVALLAYHAGPGVRHLRTERALALAATAGRMEHDAVMLQAHKHEACRDAIEARRARRLDPTPERESVALQAGEKETAAVQASNEAWSKARDQYTTALEALAPGATPLHLELRLRIARATIRAGQVAQGATDLEQLVEEVEELRERPSDEASAAPQFLRRARSEIAQAYYYGALRSRWDGQDREHWARLASVARQHFRALADDARAQSRTSEESTHRLNAEKCLDLERSDISDLLAQGLPKDCPGGACEDPGEWWRRKTRRPSGADGPRGDDREGSGYDNPGGW
jgi:hypothetical protein